jgi:hypothetical protein
VRVRIAIGWRSVGGPASVADANVRLSQMVAVYFGNQVVEFAGFFAGLQTGFGDNRYSSRVVATVLETSEATQQNIYR